MPLIRVARFTFLCVWFLWAGVAQGQTTISASVNITRPSPSCSVSDTQDLSFGSYELASGTAGAATITPTSASASAFSGTGGGTWSGSPAWATAAVTVNNTSTATTVAVTYPSTLRRSGDAGCNANQVSDANGECTIGFGSGSTAYSATKTDATFTSGGLSIPASNVGSSATRHYRIGGALSSIGLAKGVGAYEADITVTVTCGT